MSVGNNATFNGESIFGQILAMDTTDDDREVQVNSYFGITGLETIDGGGRGRSTSVSGVIYGANLVALAAAESYFRGYIDGENYVLIEADGTTWPEVQLKKFNPEGRRQQDANTGVCFRNYSASFWHAL